MKMETFEQDLINKLGAEGFKKVQSVRVGIAGAGGLGSNCAACLVRSGFKRLVIADFDKLSESNLDRQFYFRDQVGLDKVDALECNLKKINPALDIMKVKTRICRDNVGEIFGGCDIVAECLDSAQAKAEVAAGLLSLSKFVVAVSGLGGVGSSDEIKVRRIKDNLVVIGDLRSDISVRPALSPRVSVAAAKQADTILDRALDKNFLKKT